MLRKLKHLQIEDFWAIYQHFRRPTQMTFGTQIHLFADGVKPMWEDPKCAPGGKWSIRYIPKTHTNKFWEDLALALIGDMFNDENEVLGILLNLKPSYDQVQIWHASGKEQGKVDALKNDLENILNLGEHNLKLEYENFADTLAKYS